MEKSNPTFLLANNITDFFYQMKNVQNLQILGGCTNSGFFDADSEPAEKVFTIRNVQELKQIDKHERYIDFGPAVTLSQILSLGKTNMPAALYDAIKTIGTEQTRNLATIGGNICNFKQRQTLYAPLLALNAKIEIKNQNETKTINFAEFNEIPKGFGLTKIRVPIKDWEVSVFERVGPAGRITDLSAGFVFLVDVEKDLIIDTRIAFAGIPVFRPKDIESQISSQKLPLSASFIKMIMNETEKSCEKPFETSGAAPILKDQFLNLLEYSLNKLT